MTTTPPPERKDSDASGKDEENPCKSQDYQDALEDVHTRFVLNLPDSELQTADRIFFQLEQAWWFYEDFVVDLNPDKKLPSHTNLKPFARVMFEYSPLLPDISQFIEMWNEFTQYKRKISNYGCILLSKDYERVVLCQVWNGKTCTFPAGKVNQREDGPAAAARETYEETGFDPHCQFGTTSGWQKEDASKITWKYPLRELDAIVVMDNGKRRTCYVCHGVPDDFEFKPIVRKEISNVRWCELDDIPKPSYAVNPFLPQLRVWIRRHRKGGRGSRGQTKKTRTPGRDASQQHSHNNNNKKNASTGRDSRGRNSRGRDSRGRLRSNDDKKVEAGLAATGDVKEGWSEEDMLATNAKLTGRSIAYDGNPHLFEQGFHGQDPHAFRVVQGGFLNAPRHLTTSLSPPPETSRLQPLFRKRSGDDDDGNVELQPFFGSDGVTPWGDTIETNAAESSRDVSDPGQALLQLLHFNAAVAQDSVEETDVVFTDAEITAQSQRNKKEEHADRREARQRQYKDDMEFIRQWVANLPRPPPTRMFGEFKLDADAIMTQAALDVAAQHAAASK